MVQKNIAANSMLFIGKLKSVDTKLSVKSLFIKSDKHVMQNKDFSEHCYFRFDLYFQESQIAILFGIK